MRLKAKNFGPLESLDMEIKPLTVIIGKNNLGKSYATQLLYVMLSATNDFVFGSRYFPYGDRYYYSSMGIRIKDSAIEELTKRIREKDLTPYAITSEVVKLILDSESERFESILKLWLGRAFGVEYETLININSKSSLIEFDMLKDVKFKAVIKRRKITVEFTVSKLTIRKYSKQFISVLQNIKEKRKKKTYVERFAAKLHNQILNPNVEIRRLGYDYSLRRMRPLTYYIPAGRAGLIESYDTVVEALFFHAAGTPSVGLSIPPLPGMAAQFYGILRSLRGKKGPLEEKLSPIFRDLLNGDIKLKGLRLRKDQPSIHTRMVYTFTSGEKQSNIELVHAGSMIKELAPIYLIITELVYPRQFLTIEEPESHLHPGAQTKFARIIADLVKNHVKVVITTHSTIMLRKISHLVRKSSDPQIDTIDPDSVAIFWIKEGAKGNSSKLLTISKYGTLDEIPTFDEVVNELYDEELALQNQDF